MLLKTFFIILAAFLVYYFGFYPDSEKTISGEQTTQNPQLCNAGKKFLSQLVITNLAEHPDPIFPALLRTKSFKSLVQRM